jgi:hypothetical protein
MGTPGGAAVRRGGGDIRDVGCEVPHSSSPSVVAAQAVRIRGTSTAYSGHSMRAPHKRAVSASHAVCGVTYFNA